MGRELESLTGLKVPAVLAPPCVCCSCPWESPCGENKITDDVTFDVNEGEAKRAKSSKKIFFALIALFAPFAPTFLL
jgi:hypothetical protein